MQRRLDTLRMQLSKLEQQTSEQLQSFLTGQRRWESTLGEVSDELWSPPAHLAVHVPLDGTETFFDGSGKFVSGRIGSAAQFDGTAWIDLGNVGDFKQSDRFSLCLGLARRSRRHDRLADGRRLQPQRIRPACRRGQNAIRVERTLAR